MFRRSLLAVLVGVCSVAAATAGSAGAAAKPAAAAACTGTISIGMMAPITGPAASIGSDQLHWAQ